MFYSLRFDSLFRTKTNVWIASIAEFPKDSYPTRGEYASWFERQHPVVWTEEAYSSGPLPREDVKDYEENGYIVMKDVFSEKELRILGEEMDRLRRESEEISQGSVSTSYRRFIVRVSSSRQLRLNECRVMQR
eukprot:gb/GECG01000075.1/.p1 GENE.gb/GECG01000075.1/~~gb/GECG01000075.1/.p1  ORF type:complete len:133 (+),score=18.62 gb/GECG01000075.1/:1-399(+)